MARALIPHISLRRILAVLAKEFVQLRRDRLTFAMMIGVPLIQLILFGYAINTDPKHLPAALLVADQSVFARSLVRALENSDYFEFVRHATSEAEANDLLVRGDVQFVISIPEDFQRELLRGQRPAVLVEADATDPVATGNALAALSSLSRTALMHDLKGPLASLAGGEPAFELRVHRRYNPEGATEYNIVPGLIGTILTMTMVMMTAIAVTRERERGTLENLLSMPVQPFEVMLGKIVPFVVVGYIQVAVILLVGKLLFGVKARFRVDANIRKTYPEHPYIHAQDKFAGKFGTASFVALAVVRKDGEIYDYDFLTKLSRITDKLDQAPYERHLLAQPDRLGVGPKGIPSLPEIVEG